MHAANAGVVHGLLPRFDDAGVDVRLGLLHDLVDATLPHLPIIVRAMAELQQATGMRPGELCIMRPGDIDRSADVWQYEPSQHKTQNREQSRTVYIGPRAQQILRPYLLRDMSLHGRQSYTAEGHIDGSGTGWRGKFA